MRYISLILALCLGLAACGQKGDLYLPEAQDSQEQPQTPAPQGQ